MKQPTGKTNSAIDSDAIITDDSVFLPYCIGGYQAEDELDTTNPPQGGSGICAPAKGN